MNMNDRLMEAEARDGWSPRSPGSCFHCGSPSLAPWRHGWFECAICGGRSRRVTREVPVPGGDRRLRKLVASCFFTGFLAGLWLAALLRALGAW